jgi:uroporphyrinogen decarboxylase
MRGGFDKHILARGPDAIRAEVRRLTPLVEEGGFIPHCDHRVPADVPMANYIFYVEEAKQVWGKGMGNVRPMRKLKGSAE